VDDPAARRTEHVQFLVLTGARYALARLMLAHIHRGWRV
jgi:hypothetical protein